MGRGGFGGSSESLRAVDERPRVAKSVLEATRARIASILQSDSQENKQRFRTTSALEYSLNYLDIPLIVTLTIVTGLYIGR